MIYHGFAFLTALFQSLKDLTGKLELGHFNEFFIYWALLAGGSLNAVCLLLYTRAIRMSELSVTIPMITFTPMFLLLNSPVIVAEYPSKTGVFGLFPSPVVHQFKITQQNISNTILREKRTPVKD